MSDFICPHCHQIIDYGSDEFTSDREIEIQKKIDIAVRTIERTQKLLTAEKDIDEKTLTGYSARDVLLIDCKEALAKIKEIK